jgi:hypothetical protein
MTREFLFGGQPVIDIVAIPPPARLVEVVSEPSNLVPWRAVAAAGVLGHHSFAREGRYDLGQRHGCILVMLGFVARVSVAS